jgi:PadR family transcriptional regulator PadR
MKRRKSPQAMTVLSGFLEDPRGWKYGYDISRNTGLKSGTLYPILMRLADHGLLQMSWEMAETGKPPRHLYKLTEAGLRYAQEQIISQGVPVVTPDFSEIYPNDYSSTVGCEHAKNCDLAIFARYAEMGEGNASRTGFHHQ